jgi:uncharacterized protein (TIGR00730 family)
MKALCVYCGSSTGGREIYRATAATLAAEMVRRGIALVYGGGTPGLMGILADAVLEAGGTVTGVIPRFLVDKELAHRHLSQLHVVESMHDRKALMAHLSDGFVALPGGLGTLEEIVEMISWAQLGLHNKPCGLLNVDGFFDHLATFLDHATEQGFIRPRHRSMIHMQDSGRKLLDAMEAHAAPG